MENKSQYINQIQGLISKFSSEQLESLLHYAHVLQRAFDHQAGGPVGKVIWEFMNVDCWITGERSMEARMPIRWEMLNFQGILHGGMMATFIDTMMGKALKTLYPGEIIRQVTVGLNIHYLGVGKGEELLAKIELVQAGNSICVLECSVFDDTGQLINRATGTFKIKRRG